MNRAACSSCRRAAAWSAVFAGLITFSLPALADGVAIVGTELSDNGDDDGFADTYETASLRVTVQNTTGVDLHDVILRLSTTAPEISCISRPLVYLGTLAAGEIRRAQGVFVFTVGEIDRASQGLDELGDLRVSLEVHVSADRLDEPAVASTVRLELDLDVAGGSGRTTFLETFDSGSMGAFATLNLDAGRNSLAGSDGYRCQYSDPDWIGSNSYGAVTDCFLGASPTHADATFWQVDGPVPWPGRGFSGDSSLYFGVELDPSFGHTTPYAVLEAACLTNPINLAWAKVCEGDGLTECVDDLDCPIGEACVDAPPTLSFKHQVDLTDSRTCCAPLDHAADRGVVQLQLADETDLPVGHWIKLQPYLNAYDQTAVDNYFNCMFDPVDDGNTEDDFFDPTDPNRRLGPSSTCKPGLAFANLGDTDASYDPLELGNAEGPGLQGTTGLGTWVESRFNLEPFKGRRIRLRFLATSLKAGSFETREARYGHNPTAGDDGWWIDDVMVTDALTTPATMAVDNEENTWLPGFADGDGDGEIDACDTCPDVIDPAQADADGDGLGDTCDNCPVDPNPDQFDTDMDGLGDACEVCPAGDYEDGDADSVPCINDNCPTVANSVQTDADGDSLGDACDDCPNDSGDDTDEDGVCGDVDNCRFGHNPDQTEVIRVSGELPLRGGVTSWAFSLDASALVYRADQDMAQAYELYSVRTSGGLPVKVNGELTPGGNVRSGFLVGPYGQRVVYVADQDTDGVFELYSGSTMGGVPVKLNDPLVAGGRIGLTKLSPDGDRVVYGADQDTYGVSELYSVPATGGSPVKISGEMTPGGDVERYQGFHVSPDSNRVVYLADQEADDVFELYSVSVTGGAAVKLNSPLPDGGDVDPTRESIQTFQISPDGSTVVYLADQETDDVFELYGVPITGGTPMKLNGPLVPGGDVSPAYGYGDPAFRITADGSRVVYLADQETDEVVELYSVPIHGGTPVKLFHPDADQDIFGLQLSPDGASVVYGFVQGNQGVYSVPADGSETAVRLGHDSDWIIHFSPDGARVVYIDDQGELYSVPTGGGTEIKLNPPGSNPRFAGITPDSSAVIYLSHQDTDEVVETYRVPIAGGESVKLSDPLGQYGSIGAIEVSPDGSLLVYVADQTRPGQRELFATALDADADADADPDEDGILSLCDTCPGVANPDQSADTDFDHDGLACVDDNCPQVANADQVDQDVDGHGDACDTCPLDPLDDADADSACGDLDNCPSDANFDQADGDNDGVGNACDVCPFATDPGQFDKDLDGAGDACDCAPNDSATRPAAEVLGVVAEKTSPVLARFSWPLAVASDTYAVTRALISEITADEYGDCVAPAQIENAYDDAEIPALGDGFAYLIQGVSSVCGIGTPGAGPDGLERRNLDPGSCQ